MVQMIPTLLLQTTKTQSRYNCISLNYFICIIIIISSSHKHQLKLLGKPFRTVLEEREWEMLCQLMEHSDLAALTPNTTVELYYRVSKGEEVYYSASYRRLLKRNSTVVQYQCSNNFGVVTSLTLMIKYLQQFVHSSILHRFQRSLSYLDMKH